VPDATVDSFAGVANQGALGAVEPGAGVLDLGCGAGAGAGADLLIAAQMTGPGGAVIGVDMTSSMLDRAARLQLADVVIHPWAETALAVARRYGIDERA